MSAWMARAIRAACPPARSPPLRGFSRPRTLPRRDRAPPAPPRRDPGRGRLRAASGGQGGDHRRRRRGCGPRRRRSPRRTQTRGAGRIDLSRDRGPPAAGARALQPTDRNAARDHAQDREQSRRSDRDGRTSQQGEAADAGRLSPSALRGPWEWRRIGEPRAVARPTAAPQERATPDHQRDVDARLQRPPSGDKRTEQCDAHNAPDLPSGVDGSRRETGALLRHTVHHRRHRGRHGEGHAESPGHQPRHERRVARSGHRRHQPQQPHRPRRQTYEQARQRSAGTGSTCLARVANLQPPPAARFFPTLPMSIHRSIAVVRVRSGAAPHDGVQRRPIDATNPEVMKGPGVAPVRWTPEDLGRRVPKGGGPSCPGGTRPRIHPSSGPRRSGWSRPAATRPGPSSASFWRRHPRIAATLQGPIGRRPELGTRLTSAPP
jgi:hypothetical protein